MYSDDTKSQDVILYPEPPIFSINMKISNFPQNDKENLLKQKNRPKRSGLA